MSGPWRVWEICLGHMNNWGHAPFDPGELAALATGKDTPSGRQMVSRWLDTLAVMRRIKPPREPGGSTQLCVIVSRDLAWRGAGRASEHFCSEPSHRQTRKETWPESEPDPIVNDPGPIPDSDFWPPDSTTESVTDTASGRHDTREIRSRRRLGLDGT
jgi:hypothetical protein